MSQSIARWRAWLDAHLDGPTTIDDVPWAFPTGGRSSSTPNAPVIGRRELRALVDGDAALRDAMARAFNRVVGLLGLIERAGRLVWRAEPHTWASGTRQDRRVYRMLRSVHNAGLERQAGLLMAFLELVARPEALSWYRHQVAS